MGESDTAMRAVPRVVAAILAGATALALIAGGPGCYRAAKETVSPLTSPSAEAAAPAAAAAAPASRNDNVAARPGPKLREEAAKAVSPAAAEGAHESPKAATPGPAAAEGKEEPSIVSRSLPPAAEEGVHAGPAGSPPEGGGEAAAPASSAGGNGLNGASRKSEPAAVAKAAAHARGTAAFVEPPWARDKEELRFRIRFLGVTVGYAMFRSRGKVTVDGKELYLLSVRAETSGALSLIYPVREAIDYYIDPGRLTPVRQEYLTSRNGKDDQVIYDQERGRIIYRDRKTGEVSRKVAAVPNIFDPVTVAYYFRTRDLGAEDRAQPLYAGRKLWAIATRLLGVEEVDTPKGRYDTVLIQPIIMRDGRVEDKGTLRMWMTRDERHVPVRVFAKFHKILDWTLLGELVPDEKGG
ncbi:MAG: DUF3108 domain-containing protein [Deltaproteobacteria bacterium]|nr:DUF3108 domain-containing protein [Deltaproteobacteria bacterium]